MGLFPALPIRSHQDTTLNFEKLQREVGKDWTNPEAFSAKLEETATVQVRREWFGTVGRLKGLFKTKEAIPAKTALFTLPAGFRPAAEVITGFQDNTGEAYKVLRIKTSGVVEAQAELLIARFFSFDGITFPLS